MNQSESAIRGWAIENKNKHTYPCFTTCRAPVTNFSFIVSTQDICFTVFCAIRHHTKNMYPWCYAFPQMQNWFSINGLNMQKLEILIYSIYICTAKISLIMTVLFREAIPLRFYVLQLNSFVFYCSRLIKRKTDNKIWKALNNCQLPKKMGRVGRFN